MIMMARNGVTSNVKTLLQMGPANGVDIRYHNYRAFRVAAKNGHHKVVKTMLEYGADPKVNRYEPLRSALANGHWKTVLVILRHIWSNTVKKCKKSLKSLNQKIKSHKLY